MTEQRQGRDKIRAARRDEPATRVTAQLPLVVLYDLRHGRVREICRFHEGADVCAEDFCHNFGGQAGSSSQRQGRVSTEATVRRGGCVGSEGLEGSAVAIGVFLRQPVPCS